MIYVQRKLVFRGSYVDFFRKWGKRGQGWCGEMDYDKWFYIFKIALEPGEHKKIEIKEVEEEIICKSQLKK